jgi:hypothetical protein
MSAPRSEEVREDRDRKRRRRDGCQDPKEEGNTEYGENGWETRSQGFLQFSVVALVENQHQAAARSEYERVLLFLRKEQPVATKLRCGIGTSPGESEQGVLE